MFVNILIHLTCHFFLNFMAIFPAQLIFMFYTIITDYGLSFIALSILRCHKMTQSKMRSTPKILISVYVPCVMHFLLFVPQMKSFVFRVSDWSIVATSAFGARDSGFQLSAWHRCACQKIPVTSTTKHQLMIIF